MNNTPKPNLVFVGPNHLHVPLIEGVSNDFKVILYPDWDITKYIHNREKLSVVFLRFLGVDFIHSINRIFSRELSPLKYFVGLFSSLKKEKPDIIVVMDYYNLYFWQVLFYKVFAPRTKVYLYSETKMLPRGFVSKVVLFMFTKLLFLTQGLLAGIFTYSEMGKRFFQSNGLSKAVFLLPIPVDTNRYTLPSGKVFLQDDTLHIIMVARFVEYKNHEMLFLALHDLHNHSNKKFHLSLIGSSGSRRAFLEKRVEELGIAHIVIFLDRVASEDMPRIYENMDILILPSFNEAVGMVVPEAQSSGIGVIVSPSAGARDYVEDGVTGLVLSDLTVSSIGSALEKVHDKNILESFSKAARSRMCQYSPLEIVQKQFYSAIFDGETSSIFPK